MAFEIKTFDEIGEAMVNKLAQSTSKISDFSVGSVARAIVETVAVQVEENYQQLFEKYSSQFTSTAQGSDLDALGVPFGITRREAVKAGGSSLVLSASTAPAQDVYVPVGTVVTTLPNIYGVTYDYETTEAKTFKKDRTQLVAFALQIGYLGLGTTAKLTIAPDKKLRTFVDSVQDLEIDLSATTTNTLEKVRDYINSTTNYSCTLDSESTGIEEAVDLIEVTDINIFNIMQTFERIDRIYIRALTAGADYNLVVNQIKLLRTNIAGITNTTNDKPVDGGSDAETDQSLRERIQNAHATFSLTVTETFEQYAREASSDVYNAFALPKNRGAGTMDIVIISSTGQAGIDLITTVQNYIDLRKEPTVDCKVMTFNFYDVDVVETVTIPAGIDEQTVYLSIRQALQDYLNFKTWVKGDSVQTSRITQLTREVDYVLNVNLTTPATDIPLASIQIPRLNSLTITWVKQA